MQKENSRQKRNKKCVGLAILLILLICFFVVGCVSMGAMEIDFVRVFQIILAKLTKGEEALSLFKNNEVAVVWDIRLPRILCGVFVGMGLAVSGVMFQSLLRNPLADPYTLGVSSGAAFGACLAIYITMMYGIIVPVTPFAFVFAFLTLLIVIAVSWKGGGVSSSSLIIAGIIVSSILSSGISLIKMLAGENVSAIVFWLMGSLSSRTWADVALVAPVVCAALVIGFLFAEELNILALGDDTAKSLGVNIKKIRLVFLIVGSVSTAVCVAVSGMIGFVGLVVPHIIRIWLTSDNKLLLPLSACMGAFILMAADNAARLVSNGAIPVGVFTTLLGGPFFIYIFMKHQRGGRF